MKKTFILLLTAVSLTFANNPATPMQDEKKQNMTQKGKKSAPFLIMGKMPHMTKQVMMNWDELNLTPKQEKVLVQIREETMLAVKKLKPQIATLENEVAKATMNGEEPKNLKEKVDQIAKLKAKATMAHIKCIHDTKRVLTDRQLEVLK